MLSYTYPCLLETLERGKLHRYKIYVSSVRELEPMKELLHAVYKFERNENNF